MDNLPVSFSVLIAFYNGDSPSLLRRAFLSIFNNTIKPFEVIAVQDGPVCAGLKEVVDDFLLRPSFRLVRLDRNEGLARALNEGLKHVTTSYVFRADSDDFNLPLRFEVQLPYLLNGFDIVGSHVHEMDDAGSIVSTRFVPLTSEDIGAYISSRNPFNHMTVAYRLSTVLRLGGYPSLLLHEDYALWALMYVSGARMINIDKILVHASTGSGFYLRRGGIKYSISSFSLQYFLMRVGVKSIYCAFYSAIVRFIVFIAPSSLRRFIYLKFLRRSSSSCSNWAKYIP